MFFMKKKNSIAKKLSGLAVVSDGLYYLELDSYNSDDSLKVSKYEFVSYANKAIQEGTLIDINTICRAMGELKSKLGGFPCPINLGIPSREVMIKNMDYPADLKDSDLKNAIHWDFDRYFPYPVLEALYDYDYVQLPNKIEEEPKHHVIVAAMKRDKIDRLLDGIKGFEIPIQSIEPNGISAFRATFKDVAPKDEAYIVLLPLSYELQIMVGYGDSALFYRVIPLNVAGRIGSSDEIVNRAVIEIQATLSYLSSLFRGLEVTSIVVGGDLSIRGAFIEGIEGALDFKVFSSNPWENWRIGGAPEESGYSESVIGLAVRELS